MSEPTLLLCDGFVLKLEADQRKGRGETAARECPGFRVELPNVVPRLRQWIPRCRIVRKVETQQVFPFCVPDQRRCDW